MNYGHLFLDCYNYTEWQTSGKENEWPPQLSCVFYSSKTRGQQLSCYTPTAMLSWQQPLPPPNHPPFTPQEQNNPTPFSSQLNLPRKIMNSPSPSKSTSIVKQTMTYTNICLSAALHAMTCFITSFISRNSSLRPLRGYQPGGRRKGRWRVGPPIVW